jgi:hypothetical protein
VFEKLLPLFSFITPANFRSITVDQIAAAMIGAALLSPSASQVYHYPEMLHLARARVMK